MAYTIKSAKEQTFLISSAALENVASRMIGFMIDDDGSLFVNEVPPRHADTGVYALIERNGDKISISQDYCGSFGLFLYKDEEGFLLSNSFYAIAEGIPEKLSLNKAYLASFMYAKDSPADYTGTLANEITRIESDTIVEICIPTKEISFRKKSMPYFTRTLRTQEDFAILDKWYCKWVSFYRSLAEQKKPFYADISGGLDTRIILSMLINANLDLHSSVRMTTHATVNIPKDAEDMRISKIISDTLHFPLNSGLIHLQKAGNLRPEEAYQFIRQFSIERSFYSKFIELRYQTPIFSAKGLGSIIKGSVGSSGKAWNGMQEVFSEYDTTADTLLDRQPFPSEDEREKHKTHCHEIVRKHAEKLLSGAPYDGQYAATYFYKRVWIEERDVKKILINFLNNRIEASPFIDPLINTFDYNPYGDDPLFLATLILSRYAPQLLAFEIEHRAFSPDSIERAAELNRQFPPHLPAYDKISGTEHTVLTDSCESEEMTAHLRSILTSRDFKELVDSAIGKEARETILSAVPVEKHLKLPFRSYSLIALYEFLKLLPR